MTLWDVSRSSNPKVKLLLPFYYKQSQGVIFVFDSSDHDELVEAKTQLLNLLAEKDLQ
eukprot:CAMPEP_0168354570 /NCGR_PEP_ID=MMETSP0213-20121227/23980_1 /TAXON_ID=151035 /ORGANISM="Euplotes harpa, Strain FSP1.4" /LENGTH=57 /DNA_ID=CAMNT_0008366507 /DNA_START=40 /DNA_END=210 /DNA_ORIENTATION=-